MLLDAAGTIGMYGDFRQVAVMVGIGFLRVAVEILAEAMEELVAGDGGRIGFVFLARQVGAPGRQAGADRTSVVKGTIVSDGVDLGVRSIMNKQNKKHTQTYN